jgi:anti-sigma factor RsiW
MMPFREDLELHAYVDGELTAAAVTAVLDRLGSEPPARVLVASLAAQQQALRAHFPLPLDCPQTGVLVGQVLSWPDRPDPAV